LILEGIKVTHLSVFSFKSADGAERALGLIKNLGTQQLIALCDGAIASWPVGEKNPKTQLINLVGEGALGEFFWGMLLGLIFFTPLSIAAMGISQAKLASGFAEFGINDDFVELVQEKVTEGTSALFLVTSKAPNGQLIQAAKGFEFELFTFEFSAEQEDKVHAIFS
jgi:uncharacterized membrane protein